MCLVADIVADAGPLPKEPVMLWRKADRVVEYQVVGQGLTVGRKPGPGGLALPEDKLLSRSHFKVYPRSQSHVLEDLKSRNGTMVNQSDERIEKHLLNDGDIIIAGNQIFVFLDQRRLD
jgi:pSer/pThr/pTyr-binding forkhead associated (FHA) protein